MIDRVFDGLQSVANGVWSVVEPTPLGFMLEAVLHVLSFQMATLMSFVAWHMDMVASILEVVASNIPL